MILMKKEQEDIKIIVIKMIYQDPQQKLAQEFIKDYWWLILLILGGIILYLVLSSFFPNNPFFP